MAACGVGRGVAAPLNAGGMPPFAGCVPWRWQGCLCEIAKMALLPRLRLVDHATGQG